MTVKKYASIFIFFIVIIAASLASVNYIVDPYILFQTDRVVSFNDKKPAAANRSTLYKPYNVAEIRPKTIVAGNSRPEMGINPQSKCWSAKSGNVYNLTFPGLNTYGQIRAIFHAVSTGSVENILLGVDFADFLSNREQAKKNFWPKGNSDFFKRLLVDEQNKKNNSYWLSKSKDLSTALFSLDALNDSVFTILSQSANSSNRLVSGFNPAKDYQDIIRYEGAWVLFAQKKKELQQRFNKKGLSIYGSQQWSVEFESIKRLIQLALEKNIKLTLFINPYHYTYLEAIRDAGYWGELEKFKKGLLHTVKQYGKQQVMLWDFSLYSIYTVSPEPKRNDAKLLYSWFWEPAHYKSELGELMLVNMFGQACIEDKLEAAGVKLNNIDIDMFLQNQQKQRTALLHQQSIKDIP